MPPRADEAPAYWKTRAEKSDYRLTSDLEETMRFCRLLEARSRWVRVVTYGKSGQGRDLPLVILSKDRAFTPELARATGKPVVLVQNGIHAGEIEGKDASLELMRDMVVLQKHDALLDSVIVLVLPVFSVDAHERRSHYNRINQNGPELMGWRFTPIGLNLNRDYLKVEAPEMRAMISAVYTKWWPHLLIDNHTTDGADFRHDIGYAFNHGPGMSPGVTRWLTDAFEGRAMERLKGMGHLPTPYVDFRRPNDPTSGFDFDDSPPRFSTGYPPLHGRPGILVETHMLKPYATRVRATYDLMLATLEEIAARPRALTSAVATAEAEAIARGRTADPARREVVLRTRVGTRSDTLAFKGWETRWEQSEITGARVPRYTTIPWDTPVPVYREVLAALRVRQPVGYVVPQEWTDAIDRLNIHGVAYRRFAAAWRDTVEMQRIADWSAAPRSFEGHHTINVNRVTVERQLREFAPGDVWVPLDQRSGAVAVHLFEAQAPDGLLYWNVFDTVLENKEYGEDYVVEPLARAMLRENPALASEFQAKVAADTAFAKSPQARTDFFFRRSRWADPEQNLLPVARALRAPPETVLAKP
ncbi:MAG TPA: M14 family metallopeptidase [Candidatus Eisenbacteria bacterium]|nr:M14 family metallopeptidase [Candidatus Eisenbacteria bacterium]